MKTKRPSLRFLIPTRLFLACALLLSGCEGQHISGREAGALAGGALGTGLGAIIGHKTGHLGGGMAIGGGAGAIAGALIGNESDNANAAIREQESELDGRDREIEENRRMLEELRGKGLDVRDTDRGVVVNLPDVLFEFDSADLTHSAYNATHEIANVLKKSRRHALIEGHTDSIGTEQYNLNLSRRRAQSVSQALESEGVSPAHVTTRGLGERDPVASNDSEAGRERNRRVEVIVQR